MDRVDLILLIIMAVAAVRGIYIGLIQLALSTIGFILGLFVGSYIAPKIILHNSTALSRLLLVLFAEVFFGLLFAILGELAGARISSHFQQLKIRKINQALGATFEVLAIIVLIWLISPGVSKIQSLRLGYYTRHSIIVKVVDNLLHTPPNILAKLQIIINPNSFPNVFLGIEPQHTTVSPKDKLNNQAIIKDLASVVKVYGQGCGDIVEGSGFVDGKDYIVTNAHVIAGVANPEVVDQSGTYRAIPIWFDPNVDLAVLRVSGLKDSSLAVSSETLVTGDAAAVLGYPNDGPLLVKDAVVIDEVNAEGQNIYNQGSVYRNIYELQADVEPGNSGGPLIGPNGSVYGIVFAKSVSQNNVGYALLSTDFQSSVIKAEYNNRPVSDGQCTS